MHKLIILKIKNKIKRITPLVATLPILSLEDKKNCKTRYFGEIINNYDLKNKPTTDYDFFYYWYYDEKIFLDKIENLTNKLKVDNSYSFSIDSILSGDFTNYNYIWFGILNTDGQLDPTTLSLVYLNIMAILVFTLLFIEYPLVPILFIMELIMFIPVLLLYLFASESTFVFLIYIINAVTVEAVSAVGIAMMYLTGWKFKDTINPDALEANSNVVFSIIFFDRKVLISDYWSKKYSWYWFIIRQFFLVFFKFFIHLFKKYLLFLTFLLLILSCLLINKLIQPYFIYETYGFDVFFYLINKLSNSIQNKYGISSDYFEISFRLNNSINFFILKKNRISSSYALISEFFYSKNLSYSQFLNNKSINFDNFKYNFVSNLYFLELIETNKNKILNNEFYVRYHNYHSLENTYWKVKENPNNLMFLINQMHLSLKTNPNLDNFGNLKNNNTKIDQFYSNHNSFFSYKQKTRLSNNRFSLLDYELNQLSILGLVGIKNSNYNNSYLKRYRVNEDLLNKFILFGSKNKTRKISLIDLDNSVYSIKKLNNKFNKKNIANIIKYINLSLKNLNYFDYLNNSEQTINNYFNIELQKKNYSIIKKNNFNVELGYLDFKNLEKFSTIWITNFFNSFKNKLFLNKYLIYPKIEKLNNYNDFNFKYYKFYFKKNYTYYSNFKNDYSFIGKNLIKINYKYYSNIKKNLFSINKFFYLNPLNTIYFLNLRKFIKLTNNYQNNIVINKEYSLVDNVFYSLPKLILNWADKSQNIIKSPNTKTLPWFEGYNDDLEIFDTRAINLFSDFTFLSEILKIDLTRKSKFINYMLNLHGNEDFYKNFMVFNEFYLKKNFLKLNNKPLGFENNKKLLTNVVLDYNFNDNGIGIKRRIYTELLSKYYEKEIYLKRIKKINIEFPISSNRSTGLLYKNEIEFGGGQIYSEQSKEFGLISEDFLGENQNKLRIFKNNTNSWNNFNKIYGLFSYKKPINSENIFNSGLSVLGSNFYIKNYNFNNFNSFWKSINYSIGSSSEVGSGSFNFKKLNKNLIGSDTDTYVSEINDGNKNIYSVNSHLNHIESSEKIKLFNLPKKNYNDLGVDYFENNIKKYNNKSIVNKRFLLTFKKKLKIRQKFLEKNLTRMEGSFSGNSIKKLLGVTGSVKFKLKNIMQSHKGRIGNIDFFKILFKNNKKKKISIVNNLETFEKSTRSSIDKPHTLYGYLWDEYLRQTYGIGINFINFNNKTLKIPGIVSNKQSTLKSTNFLLNLNNNLKSDNNIIGLSKDREIANVIIRNYLPKIGFFREIESMLVLKKQKQNDVVLYPEDVEPSVSGFLDYQKKILFSESILKKKLIKKSISNILKYSESPVGFKKKYTQIGVKLPYFKRKFLIKNERPMENVINGLKKYGWSSTNNNVFDKFGRVDILSQINDNNYFGNSSNNVWNNWKESIYDESMLDESSDFEFNDNVSSVAGLIQTDFNKSSSFFYDFDDDSNLHSKMFLKSKRSLDSQKIINKKVENIFKTNKLISGFSNIENNQILKKKKNLRLFRKLELVGDSVFGSQSIEKYNNSIGFEKNILFTDIINNRRDLHVNDYYIFKNPIIEHLRNSNLYLKNLNYNNFKKIKKRKDSILNLHKKINKNIIFMRLFLDEYPNQVLLENSINTNLKQSSRKGSLYKIPNYLNTQYFSFTSNLNIMFGGVINDIKLTTSLKNPTSKTYSIDNKNDYQWNTFQTKFLKYDIKYSRMGLYSTSFNPFIKYGNYYSNWKLDNNLIYQKLPIRRKFKNISNYLENTISKNSLLLSKNYISLKKNKNLNKFILKINPFFVYLLKIYYINAFVKYVYTFIQTIDLKNDLITKYIIYIIPSSAYSYKNGYSIFFFFNFKIKKISENFIFSYIVKRILKNYLYYLNK